MNKIGNNDKKRGNNEKIIINVQVGIGNSREQTR
jgi:hypothetical protein